MLELVVVILEVLLEEATRSLGLLDAKRCEWRVNLVPECHVWVLAVLSRHLISAFTMPNDGGEMAILRLGLRLLIVKFVREQLQLLLVLLLHFHVLLVGLEPELTPNNVKLLLLDSCGQEEQI